MTETPPQRLSTVGPGRAVGYALLVGGAAYLVALAYGPDDPLLRLLTAVAVGVAYVAVVHVVALRRRV